MRTALRRRVALGAAAAVTAVVGSYAMAVANAGPGAGFDEVPQTTTSDPKFCPPPGTVTPDGRCEVHPTTAPSMQTTSTSAAPVTTASLAIYAAVDDVATTTINDGLEVDVLANDTVPPGSPGAGLSIDADPVHGTAEVVDSEWDDLGHQVVFYSPDQDYEGVDSFVYTGCVLLIEQYLCDEATVTVTVKGSDMPILTTTSTTVENTTTTIATTVDETPSTTTSTTVAAVVGESSATTSTVSSSATELPRTGGQRAPLVWLAFGILIAGAAAIALGRPKPTKS